jgi:alpha-L-fucosidase
MQANSKSIYQCTFAPDSFETPINQKLTYNPTTKRLYLHVYAYPNNGTLVLTNYVGKIKYAQLLHDYSEVRMAENGKDIIISLPMKKPNYEIPVVELILK